MPMVCISTEILETFANNLPKIFEELVSGKQIILHYVVDLGCDLINVYCRLHSLAAVSLK